MFKKITCTLAATLMSATASAALITDTVEQNQFVNWWGSHSYTHNINDDGFVPGSAISGNLSVALSDDGGWFDGHEIVAFIIESFDFDTGGFTFGSTFAGDLEVNALGAINADGLLNVTVQSLWGDFYVGNSVLNIVTSDVPEPGSIGLISLGLLALGFARRAQKA